MDEPRVVTVFVRDGGEVLVLRRSDGADSHAGKWDAVTGRAERDPDRVAHEAIREETSLTSDAVTPVRAGDSFEVADSAGERRWIVSPHLFDTATRDVTTNPETTDHEWISPTEIRRRETVPGLWRSYERVSPTLETIETDRERGSAALSMSALRVLRDRAGVLADRTRGARDSDADADADEPGTDGDPSANGGWNELASLARALRAARPSMVAVRNRVNRAMAAADERRPEGVERSTQRAIERAASADGNAAGVAAAVLAGRESFADRGDVGDGDDEGDEADRDDDPPIGTGPRILTLSRSGTVIETVRRAEPAPEEIVIAESRPGREGIGVAAELSSTHSVTLVADAGVASVLCEYDIDALVVGADTVFSDGDVLNKVGTRSAAIAAAFEGIPTYVVAASAKISPDSSVNADREARAGRERYDAGESAFDAWNPTFDVTPAEVVSGICTERGVLTPTELDTIVEELAEFAVWDEQ